MGLETAKRPGHTPQRPTTAYAGEGHGCCDGSVSPINDGDGSMSSINDGEGGFGASTGGKSFGRISGRIYCRIKDSELSSWVGLEFPHMPQIWAPQMWF